MKKRDPSSRFLRFISCENYFSDECWIWTGGLAKDYGHFWVNGKAVKAHKWSWEQTFGPVPIGYHLDHLCKNPRCVNPAHLELVTIRENILRGSGPCAVNAKAIQCRSGHLFTPENTYIHNGKRACKKCRLIWVHRYRARIAKQTDSVISLDGNCDSFDNIGARH